MIIEKYKGMLDKKQREHQQQLQEYEEKLKSLQGKWFWTLGYWIAE